MSSNSSYRNHAPCGAVLLAICYSPSFSTRHNRGPTSFTRTERAASFDQTRLLPLAFVMHLAGILAFCLDGKPAIRLCKSVVASAVNEEGEQVFPRKWNHEFVDMPVVDKSKQNTPHFSSEVITGILTSSKGYKQMFCALLGGTGLRAGEALGLEVDKHISVDFRTLYVRQKVRRGQLEDFLKTEGGRRDVDLCPALAEMLKKYVGERTSGFLFRNKNGNSFSQTNLLRRGLHPALKKLGQPKAGFHAFRRFRTTWLRKNRTPEDLIRFWLGHADESVTDGYSKLREDVEYRREVADKIGLGFEISPQTPDVVPNVPSLDLAVVQQNAA
jgi:integrase